MAHLFVFVRCCSFFGAQMNTELKAKSAILVDTLNTLAVDYIPLLQRIMVKATTAALAEDEPSDGSAAGTPISRSRTSSTNSASSPAKASAAHASP